MRTSYIVIILSLFFFIVLLHSGVFDSNPVKGQIQHQGNNVVENPPVVNHDLLKKIILISCIILLGVFLSYKLMNNPCNTDYNQPGDGPSGGLGSNDIGAITGSSCRFGGLDKEDSNKTNNVKRTEQK